VKNISQGATLAVVIILLSILLSFAIGTPQTLSLNADSGITRKVIFTQLWSFDADKSFVVSPVVANGFLYVTSIYSEGSEVTLCCINASSGTQVWNSIGLFYTFTVANGYLYIGSSFLASTHVALEGVVCNAKSKQPFGENRSHS
jgi:outer membrane protein assembly factor BamB